MKFKTYTTPKGNSFKLITKTDKLQIGYQLFFHNHNPKILKSENVELANENYVGICFCASVLPDVTEGMDIPRALMKDFPATEWMQVDPMYAFCTIGMTMDLRLLRDEGPQGTARFKDLLDSFHKFITKDVCAKGSVGLADLTEVKKDLRRTLMHGTGRYRDRKKITNWDNELDKLMGVNNDKKKIVE